MISQSKDEEFRSLFSEFAKHYLSTSEGEKHLRFYDEGRLTGRKNFEAIKAMSGDVTDSVLRGLLPHTNSAAHRASGAWIHIAPTVQGDIKDWFEGVGWTRREDWPNIARAIFRFVARCADDPRSLDAACSDFVAMQYTKGFQTGQMSPILNAISPDCFLIINNKSRKVINYLTDSNFKQPLTSYAAANEAGRALVAQLSSFMQETTKIDARPSDLFDIYCHWLVAIKKHGGVSAVVGKKIKTENSEVIVTVPDDTVEKAGSTSTADATEPRQSYRIQAALAHIGAKMGFRIWVPRNDRQNILALIPVDKRGLFLDELPLNYDDVTIRTIEQIDVIWLKNRSMARAFEVEHTTAIYSGLLRMADLLALQPNMDIRLHIAAPTDRREKVRQEILRPTFSLLERGPLYRMCSFLSYSAVEEMNSLPHLEHMNGSIVDKYEDAFADEED
ncbi:hypothetical protein [Bradyrhizobium pachyrhizi]|uniref:hypothetical protein n=1 Tax=Bradyrhizobium pachyrhizi TaxID=280333 RepID=UPI000AA66B8D|nr:hypothetical protein [Bradyrhizobium pachyrhizi]